ncbi:MAG: ABC transporter permease [Ruminococcus sp.]|nr:ABC transporter permease [Ruminococcus sp.]MCR5015298.1 ABC transporter permease [Ruminococcus sp.]
MNDENNFGAPVLDDIDYVEPTPKKEGPTGVAAPVLDDFEYVAPEKKGGPTGVAAVVLDDMSDYTAPAAEKKGAPTGVAAPVLDDEMSYTAPQKSEKLVMTDEEIIDGMSEEQKAMFANLPQDKQQQVIDMRRQQLGAEAPAPAVAAPVLDEDNYVPPPKTEKPAEPVEAVTAPILDDEPEAPKYVPKFVDEDLERAKREGAKKAVSSGLVSEQKDPKESLRMMIELKEQLRQEEAKKGFKVVIILGIIGVIGAIAFFLLYSGSSLLGIEYKEEALSGISNIIKEASLYIAVAMGATGLVMISGVGFLKTLASLVYLLAGIIQVFPGLLMISLHEGSLGLIVTLFVISIACTIAVFGGLSGLESVGQYFNRNKRIPEREYR